ncbi:hypothetical protein SARC_03485 [Sphaeroforma arctica JP610]|uniref:Uncharacterized protein n=1 Tax=Sphaeroforma arctica JP610 TaxID=667725 RepID=A0A0L0G5Q5_9EUKA|nr:hypothetical protein SARC_03485 [Sphaeroforma arctica JP610]KNC84284.1 hypothetical protein SARC_03485 [Sphaeroforma arctica JP610]|eukprot:XP_014158186.1 hypothetical protein SARC_03485 [Sphaeroforma arctica JP610]
MEISVIATRYICWSQRSCEQIRQRLVHTYNPDSPTSIELNAKIYHAITTFSSTGKNICKVNLRTMKHTCGDASQVCFEYPRRLYKSDRQSNIFKKAIVNRSFFSLFVFLFSSASQHANSS